MSSRYPIKINNHAVAVIHIFTKTDDLEDLWMTDMQSYLEENYNGYQGAAQQFIDQLKDYWNIAFMEALRDEIDKRIQDHNTEFGIINDPSPR